MISSLARRDASSRASNAADIAATSRARASSASLWSKLDDAYEYSRGVDGVLSDFAISTPTISPSPSRSYRRTPGVPHSLDLSLCRPGVCPPHARHGFPSHPSEIPSGVRGSSSEPTFRVSRPAGFVARAVRGHASDAGTPHARPLTRTRGVIHRPCRGPRRATPRVAIRRGFVCPPRLVGDGPGRRGWIGSSTGARDGRGRRRRRWDARRRGRGRRGGDARGIDDRVRSARREGCPPRCCTPR